jgi:UDP-glucose 4-epimerase
MLVGAGYQVIALDKEQTSSFTWWDSKCFTYLWRDICDRLEMEKLGDELSIDAVIHLAALAAPRIAENMPEETFRVNVLGTYNVLKMAKKAGAKRIIFASTAHVYGISPKYLPTDENAPLALQDTYTTSKILGEQLCELFYKNYHMYYAALRMFNGYGPGQSSDYFIPAMINQAEKGDITLRGYQITKDFIYVEDMAEAMMKVLPSSYVGALNVGTGVETTLSYVAQFIADRYNRVVHFDPQEIHDEKGPTRMQCDCSRIKATIGWKPSTTIDEGLIETINSYL